MEKIPTAEEFLLQQDCIRNVEDFFNDVQPIDLIEFAKLHVEKALKAGYNNNFFGMSYEDYIKAYPLTNIK